MHRLLFVITLLGSPCLAAAQRFELPVAQGNRWFKGNTHTHTINTDGDSPPDTVVTWYRARGYNFLVVSDHDTITEPATLQRYQDSAFILVRGEEVTARYRNVPTHLTAIGLRSVVKPDTAGSVLETLQRNVDKIRSAGGVPLINHPNYRWALSRDVLQQVQRVVLFELFNGHPQVHNDGGGNAPSMEEQWDAMLSASKRIYGVASDDAHHWRRWAGDAVNPGKGWIYVRAERLDPQEITRALESGQFYSSTGVELEGINVTPSTIEVRVRQDRDFRYRVEFIGDGGRVLARADGTVARYELKDRVTYVRARVTDSGGRKAWVQPVFVAASGPPPRPPALAISEMQRTAYFREPSVLPAPLPGLGIAAYIRSGQRGRAWWWSARNNQSSLQRSEIS